MASIFPLQILLPTSASGLRLINVILVLRNLVLQMLDLVLQLPKSLLLLRLEAVRGAYPPGGWAPIDEEESAGLRLVAAVEVTVASRMGTALRRVHWGAGREQDGGLGFAAAFEGERVVETHGWC